MKTEQEIWKAIPGYEGIYEASTLGRIRSLDREAITKLGNITYIKGKILSQATNKQGYSVIKLYLNKQFKTYSYHTLICKTFMNHTIGQGRQVQINHINHIKTDNRVSNLEICNARHNTTEYNKRQNTSSKYTGVAWHNRDLIWTSNITINCKRVWLGNFVCELEAYYIYKLALQNIDKYNGCNKTFKKYLNTLI